VGYGDNLMATGMARGAAARGKRIAFGDGQAIKWDQHSAEVFRGNSNIAPAGSEGAQDIEWVDFYKGHRLYNQQDGARRWIWNMDFRPTPGELFFHKSEQVAAQRIEPGFVLIEPEVPAWKSCSVNKDWGAARYQAVADDLKDRGLRLVQFKHPKSKTSLAGVSQFPTLNFRDSLAVMQRAALYIGPEGGLHHGAAAVETPAVVIFGGFIPPAVTGYDTHTNLTGGADEACGSLRPCSHCRAALDAITPADVVSAALERL